MISATMGDAWMPSSAQIVERLLELGLVARDDGDLRAKCAEFAGEEQSKAPRSAGDQRHPLLKIELATLTDTARGKHSPDQ
jgi:hypothetical protein